MTCVIPQLQNPRRKLAGSDSRLLVVRGMGEGLPNIHVYKDSENGSFQCPAVIWKKGCC